MAARPSLDDLPPELLEEILSRLSWGQQLAVRRVSRRWQQASEACLARRQELHISEADVRHSSINTDMLLNTLQAMPALRRLCVVCGRDWRRVEDLKLAGGWSKMDVDSAAKILEMLQNCQEDIALDSLSVERLCDSCPQLQEVRLQCTMGRSGVETLLGRLPQLRSLHLGYKMEEVDSILSMYSVLKALSLFNRTVPDLSGLRHLAPCPQLRQLHLFGRFAEQFVGMLVVFPGLEQLLVADCADLTWEWLPQLTHCPQLRELDISDHWRTVLRGIPRSFDSLSSILTACGRLERLRLNAWLNPVSASPTISRHSLTHLDISSTGTDDEILYLLAGLLPGLCDLRLRGCDGLTTGGLARGLPHFTDLRVLDLRDVYAFIISDDGIVSLSGNHLKMLAYGSCELEAGFFKVARVFDHCRTLAVLRIKSNKFDVAAGFSLFVDELAGSDREITLLLPPAAIHDLPAHLPGNLRVLEDSEDVWDELTGWRRPGVCGC